MPRKTLHDIAVEFVRETQKAVCYSDGIKEFWIPKSICGEDGIVQLEEANGSTTLTAPEWWLHERGLI